MFKREMSPVLRTAPPDKCFKPSLHILYRLYLQKQSRLIPHNLPHSLITLINTPQRVRKQSTDFLHQLKNTDIYCVQACSFSVGKFSQWGGLSFLSSSSYPSTSLLLTFQICPALSPPPRAFLLSYQFLSDQRSSDKFSRRMKTRDASS